MYRSLQLQRFSWWRSEIPQVQGIALICPPVLRVQYILTLSHTQTHYQTHDLDNAPIQSNFETLHAICANFTAVGCGSSTSVSTPGAPNIRMTPFVVPNTSHSRPTGKPIFQNQRPSRLGVPQASKLVTGSYAKATTSACCSSVRTHPTFQSTVSRSSKE